MSNHISPTDLAKELGLEESELLRFCGRESIPIFHGRIDRTLVEAQMKANGNSSKRASEQ